MSHANQDARNALAAGAAADLLHRLIVRGVRVTLAADDPRQLDVTAADDGRLTADDLAELRRRKPAVLRLLNAVDLLDLATPCEARHGPRDAPPVPRTRPNRRDAPAARQRPPWCGRPARPDARHARHPRGACGHAGHRAGWFPPVTVRDRPLTPPDTAAHTEPPRRA